MAGIKETLDVMNLAAMAAVQAKEIMADGKVNALDLPKLVPLWQPMKDAIDNAAAMKDEMADLDKDEVKALVAASLAVVMAWYDVFTPGK